MELFKGLFKGMRILGEREEILRARLGNRQEVF